MSTSVCRPAASKSRSDLPVRRAASVVCAGLAVAGCVSAPTSGFAQVTPIVENFATTGALSGSTPGSGVGSWATISGSGGLGVSGGTLAIAGSSGQSAQLNFSNANVSTGVVYLGFDYSVSAGGTLSTSDTISGVVGFRSGTNTSGSYALSFGTFRPSASASSTSGLAANATNQVTAGIFTGSSQNASTTALTAWSSALTRGDTYRVVVGLDTSSNTATLWINPTATTSTSVVLSGVSLDPRGVFVREGSSSHGAITLDRLFASENFEVAAGLTAVPEPSTYAAIGGAVALLTAVAKRRRRQSGR